MLITIRQVQSFMNRLSNTGHAWDSDEMSVQVSSGQEEYTLNAGAAFGKPLLVVTSDPSNASHVERPIDFFEVQNIDLAWGLPNDAASLFGRPDGSTHTAERMAFFRKNGNPTVRVKPLPQEAAEYKILYSIGNWVDAAGITDSPVLSEHHQLPETNIAIAALPHAAWFDDEKENRIRRRELAEQLTDDRRQFDADFERYVLNLNQPQVTFRMGADEW